mgnify:CR=1 FL=1
MNNKQLTVAADVLKALAHPVRLGVLQCLEKGEYNVSELTRQIGCSQSMMSQQLAILEQHQLVQCHKVGTVKYCSIKNPEFLKMLSCLEQHLENYVKREEF